MKVVVSQNFDVHGGVVNGSVGTLKSIRYSQDSEGRRHLLSCIVHIPDADDKPLVGLPPRHLPVLQDKAEFKLKHPDTGRQLKLERYQVPIQPAYDYCTFGG